MAICNRYLYPGHHNSMGSRRGPLRRGSIYSVRPRKAETTAQDSTSRAGSLVRAAAAEVDYTWRKVFQFNQPDLGISLQNANVDPAGTETPGGNFPTGMGLGLASSRFEFFFNREQEVARCLATGEPLWGVPFKDIGVAKDIYDLYSVMVGAASSADYEAAYGRDEGGVVADEDLNPDHLGHYTQAISNLTSRFFDLAQGNGTNVLFQPVAIVYNVNLVVSGLVTSMAFTFTKFNHMMVPVWATSEIELQILSIANASAPTTAMVLGNASENTGTPTATTPTPPGSAAANATSAPTVDRGWIFQTPVVADPDYYAQFDLS